jgi:hypothetical protein
MRRRADWVAEGFFFALAVYALALALGAIK